MRWHKNNILGVGCIWKTNNKENINTMAKTFVFKYKLIRNLIFNQIGLKFNAVRNINTFNDTEILIKELQDDQI